MANIPEVAFNAVQNVFLRKKHTKIGHGLQAVAGHSACYRLITHTCMCHIIASTSMITGVQKFYWQSFGSVFAAALRNSKHYNTSWHVPPCHIYENF